MRSLSFPVAAALALPLLVAACAGGQSASPSGYDVSGEIYQADSRIRVFINGEQVADGYLPMTETFDALGKGDVFPLQGSYQGAPVEVGCGRQPFISYPFCEVTVAGELVEVLRFGPESGKSIAAAPSG